MEDFVGEHTTIPITIQVRHDGLLGKIHAARSNIGKARHCYHQSLVDSTPHTDPQYAAHVLEVIAALATNVGDSFVGARFWGQLRRSERQQRHPCGIRNLDLRSSPPQR